MYSRKEGATLVEVLVVAAIVLVIGAIVVPVIRYYFIPPYKVEKLAEWDADKLVFAVPTEGDGQSVQINDPDLLRKKQVFGGRMTLPLRWKDGGRGARNGQYISTVNLIEVDRTPEMRYWTQEPDKGTSQRNEALQVQDKHGTKFCVPLVSAAVIDDELGATFQTTYSGRTLSDVLDSDVRGYVGERLAKHFQEFDLDGCRLSKVEVVRKTQEETRKEFKQYGLSILYVGMAGGLLYKNEDVQTSIDKEYSTLLEREKEVYANKAKLVRNQLAREKAYTEQQAAKLVEGIEPALQLSEILALAKERAALEKTAMETYSGKQPVRILPSGDDGQGGILLRVDAPAQSN